MKLWDTELSGQTGEMIQAACASGRLPHTSVVTGGSADERLGIAKYLAAAHLCESEFDRPCGECGHCRKVRKDAHPDIRILTATHKDKKPLSAEKVRENVIEQAYKKPIEGSKTVFILHNMDLPVAKSRDSVQNILLKLTEDPPKISAFVLTCAQASSLLNTVLSRATVYDLGPAKDDLEDPKYARAIQAAGEMAAALYEGDEFRLLCASAPLEGDNRMVRFACGELKKIFRDALAEKKLPGGEKLSEADRTAEDLSGRFTDSKLLDLIEISDEIAGTITLNPNNALLITRLCSLLASAANR